MNKKTFFLLLVILVVAYVAAAGRGFFQQGEGESLTQESLEAKMDAGEFPPAWLSGLNSAFTQKISAKDIKSCEGKDVHFDREKGVVSFSTKGANCTLTFHPSSYFKTRSLEVKLIDPQMAIEITAPTKNKDGQLELKSLDLPTVRGKSVATCAVGNADAVIITCKTLVNRRAANVNTDICEVQLGD